MTDRRTARRRIVRVEDGVARATVDVLAAEQPVEIRVDGQALTVTMRTPGADFELALGFCLTEGVVDDAAAVAGMRYCTSAPGPYQGAFNTVEVALRDGAPVAAGLHRHVATTSACGVCGTTSLEAVRKHTDDVDGDRVVLDAGVVAALPDRLRDAQRVFDRTGGLHAAGLFTGAGETVCVREDVGRHNAVDKVIGWAATERRLPLRGHVLVVSGRVAFEIVQKALRAGIPAIAAVSAPTSLAVTLAEETGMTLVGFVRPGRFNVYTGADRLTGLAGGDAATDAAAPAQPR